MINYKKMHRKEQQMEKRKADLSGTGTYLFENNTKGDLDLPRVTKEGIRKIKFGGQFFGDDYYFNLLKSGEIRLVKEINEQAEAKLFVYKNFNRDEVKLPEPNRDGQYIISPNGEFVGDHRYFSLLKAGRLKLIREIEMPQEKLITEQPPVITTEGQVEFIKDGDQFLTEEQLKKKKLLKEDNMDGVKLLLG